MAPSKESEAKKESEKVLEGNRFSILAPEHEEVCIPAGVKTVSSQKGDHQAGVSEWSKGGREEKDRQAEDAARARASKTEAVPSAKDVEEHNVDSAVFRSWRPRCVKGRAESQGHRTQQKDEKEVPVMGVDYAYTPSELDKEGDKAMPTLEMNDSWAKMIMAKVAPSEDMRERGCTGEHGFECCDERCVETRSGQG
jgi:hypothetical protein